VTTEIADADPPGLDDGAAIADAVRGLDDRIIPLLLHRRETAGQLYSHPSHRLVCERAASVRYAAVLGLTGPDLAAMLHRQALRAWHGSDAAPGREDVT
jgi:alkylhydroperoxidase family enzyme